MDSRIDLTQNRDFRKRRRIPKFHNKKGNYPWSKIQNWTSFSISYNNSLIFTGNKQQRLKQKKDYEFDYQLSNTCFKCGKFVEPWNEFYGLCFNCSQEESETKIDELNTLPMTEIFKNKMYKKVVKKKNVVIRDGFTMFSSNQWIDSDSLIVDIFDDWEEF